MPKYMCFIVMLSDITLMTLASITKRRDVGNFSNYVRTEQNGCHWIIINGKSTITEDKQGTGGCWKHTGKTFTYILLL